MTNRLLTTLLVLATVSVPMAAADLQSTGLDGGGLNVKSDSALVALNGSSGQSMALHIGGAAMDVQFVTEYSNRTFRNPTNQYFVYGSHERTVELFSMAEGSMATSLVRNENAIVIIEPLSAKYDVEAANDGPFSLRPIARKQLESSHVWPGDAVPRNPAYYEYLALNTLELQVPSNSQFSVRGDFQVYVWGVDVTFRDATTLRTDKTGYSLEDRRPVAGIEPTFRFEEFSHAVVTVHDGVLSYRSDQAPAALYASRFQAEAFGTVEIKDAQGTVPARDGEYLVAGTTKVQNGAYEWSRSDGGVGVRFLGSGEGVQGDSVSFQPAPLIERSWFVPVALAVMALLAAAAVYLAPAVAGRRADDAAPGLAGLRAAGFSRWASAADTGGRPERAAFWAGRAHRILPHDPHVALARAIYLAQVGRSSKALGLHAAAHEGFRLGNDLGQVGHNAYQAAKTALRGGRPVEALDWLRVAAESEPVLASDLAQDPAFAKLRSHPDYLSLVGPFQGLVTR